MRDIKSKGGVKTGRMRSGNVNTTHTKWCATLTQKAKIKRLPVDIMVWFKENEQFSSARDKNKFVSFSTGLISDKDNDDINPEKADAVGLELQKLLDNGNYGLTLPT